MKSLLILTKNEHFKNLSSFVLTHNNILSDYVDSVVKLKNQIQQKEYLAVILDITKPTKKDFMLWSELLNITCIPVLTISTNTDDPSRICSRQTATLSITKPLLNLIGELNKSQDIIELAPDTFFDISKHCIWKENNLVHLSTQEFKLLFLLCSQDGKIFKSEELIQQIDLTGRSNLYVHIKNIREKIEDNPSDPDILISKYGEGYYLKKKKSEINIENKKGAV